MNLKIVEKIQKLLALSESCNEHEAALAIAKAQELLIKHKLSMKEIKNIKIHNRSIKEKRSKITFTKAKWKANLASLIADNFGCYYFFKTRYTNTIVFFGRDEDIQVCNIVLEYSVYCIENSIKKLQYQYRKSGQSVKGLGNDYAIGFIHGLKKQFEEQKKKHEEWGLVLVKDKEVMEAYEEKEFAGSVNTSVKLQGHNDVYYEGHKDGETFSISDKIAEGSEEALMSLQRGISIKEILKKFQSDGVDDLEIKKEENLIIIGYFNYSPVDCIKIQDGYITYIMFSRQEKLKWLFDLKKNKVFINDDYF